MAKLYFYYGAMGACKTATLLTTAFNYEEKGQSVITLKPAKDTKGGKFVSSRLGITRPCGYLEDFKEQYENKLDEIKCDVILVDEIQFANKEEIDFLSDIVDYVNIPVICYGLRADFIGNMFPGSERLLALADNIIEIKTMCWCGHKATVNVRFNELGIIKDGEQVLIGGNAEYTGICRKHCKLGQMKKPE